MKYAWLIAALAASCVAGLDSARAQPLTIRDAGQAKRRGDSDAKAQPDRPGEETIDAIVTSYRHIWDGMSALQRDLLLKGGGVTPEQYEERLRRLRSLSTRSAAPPVADSNAAGRELPSVSSTRDLTAIRDGNLRRVQNDGCPAEVVARLAELNSRSMFYLSQLVSPAAPSGAIMPPPSQLKPAPPGSAAAIAADWFKAAPSEAAAKSSAQLESTRLAALDSVLGPASRDPELGRKQIEAELSRIDSEVARLTGACPGLR